MTAESIALADLATLLSDRTRAAVCAALLDGRAWTAGELARTVGVTASTMSEHVTRLVAGGLAVEHRQGRHRYVQLASHEVAELIEALGCVAGPVPRRGGTLRRVAANSALARARTCYDHLAGRLGVVVTDAMIRGGLLDQRHGFAMTDVGVDWLVEVIGVHPETLGRSRRPLVRSCLDWTERRPHLAGAAGAYLYEYLLRTGVITRTTQMRAVRLTPPGATALCAMLDLNRADLAGVEEPEERTVSGAGATIDRPLGRRR